MGVQRIWFEFSLTVHTYLPTYIRFLFGVCSITLCSKVMRLIMSIVMLLVDDGGRSSGVSFKGERFLGWEGVGIVSRRSWLIMSCADDHCSFVGAVW